MSGFGTVVTGTLSDGHLSVGDEVEILPAGLFGRIRGLQTHKQKEDTAIPGSRTAVNISGVNIEQIQRGAVVAHPNQYQATRRLDARFRLLKDVSTSLKHGDEVKFFVSASETIATIRLLGTEEFNPNEEGWIQLELRDPIVAVRGDRYILRCPSPSETLGGGVIVDHQPKGRHKRFDEEVIRSLELLAQGSPVDVLYEAALGLGIASIKEIVTRSRLESETAQAAFHKLLITNRLIALEEESPIIKSDSLVIALPHWNMLRDKTAQLVEEHHKSYPLRRGIPREELKSKLKLSSRIFNAIITKLITDQLLTDHLSSIAKLGHAIRFNGQEQAKIQTLMRKFEGSPFSPPSVKDCISDTGEEVLNALVEMDELIAVSSDVIFRKKDYDLMVSRIKDMIVQSEMISLSEVRDLFNTSRKYVQALLEYLDANGITIRHGDFRKLRN